MFLHESPHLYHISCGHEGNQLSHFPVHRMLSNGGVGRWTGTVGPEVASIPLETVFLKLNLMLLQMKLMIRYFSLTEKSNMLGTRVLREIHCYRFCLI
jgi:hypothetical protein